MLLLPLFLSALSASVLAAPSSSPLSPALRRSVGRLSESQRRELASSIAAQLFGRADVEVDEDVLKSHVITFLQDYEAQGGEGKGALDRRLFGFGDDDNEGVLTGYGPVDVACPSGSLVRVASNLSSAESTHVNTRLNPDNFLTYLSGLNLTASDLNLVLNSSSPESDTPNVAMAFSGGGYRAMLSGGGGLYGTDFRNPEAVAAGTAGIGGVASYMAGLSGGSWMVGSYYANQNRTIADLTQNLWNLSSNLVIPDVSGFLGTTGYFVDMVSEVSDKKSAGFTTQITDYWGLALSSHLFPAQYGLQQTPNLTLSDLKGVPATDVPYPIIVACEREPNTITVSVNATVWELTYNEFGTWGFGGGVGGADSKIEGAFMQTEYLGTNLNGGLPTETGDKQCTIGFDNLGFAVGTSSTLFNGAFSSLVSANASGVIVSAIEGILGAVGEAGNDVASYPNPFYGFANESNPSAQWESLTLIDCGETNQNVPFEPLLVPARNVDTILAFDSSADTTYFYPNGTALYTTYQRFDSLATSLNHTPFMPTIPHMNTFVNTGLNQHPVFFGCSADARPNTTTPLVIYVPNYPWSTASNVSTYQLQYETSQALDVVNNGARTLTLNNTLPAEDWSTCLACAFADRAVARGGSERSQVCRECFGKWCWDGVVNDTMPSAEYEPVVGTVPAFLANLGANKTDASTSTPTSSGSLSSATTAVGASTGGAIVGRAASWAVGVLAAAVSVAMQL